MDCGARDIFEGLCNNNAGNANKSVAIFSGIMDSSSSTETYTNNNSETQKTFVVDLPFMYLLDQPGDQRIYINASVGPTTNYRSVQIQFTYVKGTITRFNNINIIYFRNSKFTSNIRLFS